VAGLFGSSGTKTVVIRHHARVIKGHNEDDSLMIKLHKQVTSRILVISKAEKYGPADVRVSMKL
jgi:hypothetical protein